MRASLRYFIVGLLALVGLHSIRGADLVVTSPAAGAFYDYYLKQTVRDKSEEAATVLTVSAYAPTSYSSASFELRGNNLTIPLSRVAPIPGIAALWFAYSKTSPDYRSLNAEIPPGPYDLALRGAPVGFSAPLMLGASAPPIFRVINFEDLQAWKGGALDIKWTLINPLGPPLGGGAVVEIFRSSGVSAYRTGRVVAEATLTGLVADPGEVLLGTITYNFPTSSPSLFSTMVLEFPIKRAAEAPVITTQPKAQNVLVGDKISLAVVATGTNPNYQWRKSGADIDGATKSTFSITEAQVSDSGSYSVVVSNSAGSVNSDSAEVTVAARVFAPTITENPSPQTVAAGTKISFTATATGTAPLAYQWKRDGTIIAGATGSTLVFEHPKPSDGGQYSVTVTNAVGSITSNAAELKVSPVSRISNLSILSSLGSASDSFTLGFVVAGLSGSAVKPILIRAVGPSLTPLGVQGAVDDPKLELFAGSTSTGSNDNWAGDAALDTAFKSVGAFGFANATSRDAAVMARVSAANNSVKVSGTGSGLVLAELYDATLADDFEIASPRLANVSVLKDIGSGLTTGFVVSGVEPVRLLVRAIGPTLGGFGVGGALDDPKLDLFQSGNATAMASNDNWGSATNATQVAAAAASVGAFALATDSKDAVLLVTLAPGSYTAQVSGVNNSTGTALVEVYEVR